MRLVLIQTALLLFVIAYGCSSDSNDTSAANEGNTANEGSEVAEPGEGGAPSPITPGDNDGDDQADTDGDDVESNTDSGEMTEDSSAPTDDMSDSSGGSLYERALAVAASLDVSCQADCEKDLMCNPNDALSIAECLTEYCGFVEVLEEVGPQAATESLIGCFEAQIVLSDCFVSASCEAYTAFYYTEELPEACAAEVAAIDLACEDFTTEDEPADAE